MTYSENSSESYSTTPSIHSEPAQPTKLIRIREVCALTGLGKTTVYDLTNAGNFPKRVHLSEKAVAWVEAEILDWIAGRIAARDAS